MALTDLPDWMESYTRPDFLWYVKRLSGNDTLAKGTHQYGPYIPKDLFKIFPSINRRDVKNPDLWIDLFIESHPNYRRARIIYYNNKYHDNPTSGRDEARITNLGGASSALLDPESNGALTIFAFKLDAAKIATECRVWVCRHETEEDVAEDRIGPVEPGKFIIWSPTSSSVSSALPSIPSRSPCWLAPSQIPAEWLKKFPTGVQIIRKAIELRPLTSLSPDQRLVKRRECEYDLFRSVEEAVELPTILAGFTTVDQFIARAQTLLQRRKSRAGTWPRRTQ